MKLPLLKWNLVWRMLRQALKVKTGRPAADA